MLQWHQCIVPGFNTPKVRAVDCWDDRRQVRNFNMKEVQSTSECSQMKNTSSNPGIDILVSISIYSNLVITPGRKTKILVKNHFKIQPILCKKRSFFLLPLIFSRS